MTAAPQPQATKAPPVSIVLTTYNRSAYLTEAIDSVLAQSFTDFELLIVDDGSSDPEPRQVAREYARRDKRVRAIALKENVGLSAARNRGAEEARGEYITFQDDDDLSPAGRLAPQVAFLDANPNCGAVRSAFVVFGDGTRTRLVAPDSPLRMRAGTSVTTAGFLDDFNHLFAGSQMSLVRRQLLLDLGGFRSWFRKSEVWDLALRILEVADLAAIPELGYYYRQHSLERLTSTTDIYMYYGTAFLCALYRETGRPEPIGKQEDAELTPLAPLAPLAPLFKELPADIVRATVDYALGRSLPVAYNLRRYDLVAEIAKNLRAFAGKEDIPRIEKTADQSAARLLQEGDEDTALLICEQLCSEGSQTWTEALTLALFTWYQRLNAAKEQGAEYSLKLHELLVECSLDARVRRLWLGEYNSLLRQALKDKDDEAALALYRKMLSLGGEIQCGELLADLAASAWLVSASESSPPDLNHLSAARISLCQLLQELPLNVRHIPENQILSGLRMKQLLRRKEYARLRRELALYQYAAVDEIHRRQLRRMRRRALTYPLRLFRLGYWFAK